MHIFINETKTNINVENLNKEKILEKVREKIEYEIIDSIHLDEVDVSLAYFKENELDL